MSLWDPSFTENGVRKPSLISTLDRHTHQLYLEARALAYLQRSHRQLVLEGAPPLDDTAGTSSRTGRKRRRGSDASDGQGGASGSNGMTGEDEQAPPHVDEAYKLDLVPAKPEPGVLVIGEPPQDVYTHSVAGIPLPPSANSKPVIKVLRDKVNDNDSLFFDADALSHEQIRGLTEYEWNRQLGAQDGLDRSAALGRGERDRRTKREKKLQQQREEMEVDLEIESLRRAFFDKARASNLASRVAAGW